MRKLMLQAVWLMLLTALPAFGDDSCRELDGLIEPSERVALSSQVPGVLVDVLVDRGDWVNAGQVVARLNSVVQEAGIELSRAKLGFGQRKMVRNRELFREKLISEQEKDEMDTESKLAELELKEAEAMLKQKNIVSPIDGIVVERLLSPGEYISDGAVMNLAAIDPLYVEVVAPVECYGTIVSGSKAEVLPQEPVGGSYSSVVTVTDPVIDAASGTFGIRLELPNSKRELPAGLKCLVRFNNK